LAIPFQFQLPSVDKHLTVTHVFDRVLSEML